jgi:hypothetical protein
MQQVTTTKPADQSLFAFPDNASLSSWSESRVPLVEQPSPNSGKYLATLDENVAMLWWLFEGTTQPSSWDEAIEYFELRSNSAVGNGSQLVDIVITSEGIPVSGAHASIKLGSEVIRSALTNASGKAAFTLDPGEYTLSVVATGFIAIVDSVLSVAGHTIVEHELEQLPMDLPSTPSTCRVRIHATRGAIGTQTRVTITTSNVGRKADRAFLNTSFDGLTDPSGLLFVDLAWSATVGVGAYRFRLIDPETGKVLHDRTCIVPSQLTANYEDLT